MATAFKRDFTAVDAAQERATTARPLLIGLTGPSGSGKTFSALRLATGIQTVVGGDIYVVDTEQRRSLDYAGDFQFKHVDFRAPFGSLDYLEALRFCRKSGAGVVVIDSCSHEHDGPGGLLEQHEAVLDQIAGNNFAKRQAMTFLAWAKVKPGRRKLIHEITTELNMPVIFCFRARRTTKPVKGGDPVEMGFTSIGADEWLFELSLNAMFLPGSNGVPIWDSNMPGEKLAIKLPKQFRALGEGNIQFSEKVGRKLALWAAPGGNKAPVEAGPRFEARPANDGSREWGPDDEPEGRPDSDHGDQHDGSDSDALAAAKAEVDRCGANVPNINSATSRLCKELGEEDADALRSYAGERVEIARQGGE